MRKNRVIEQNRCYHLLILLAVPTVVTSAFGMNVNLPFVDDPGQGDEWVFWVLTGACVVVLTAISALLVYLKKRRAF